MIFSLMWPWILVLNDDIADDFKTADGFATIVDKHSNHPSIIQIRENIQTLHHFYFTAVNDKYIE